MKQPKILFPARHEKRPRQDIPTEAARIKARMARMPSRPPESARTKAESDSKPEAVAPKEEK
jgi:hypothetical protein